MEARSQGATTVNEIEWTYDLFANLQARHRVTPASPPAGIESDLRFQTGGDTDDRTNHNQVTGNAVFSYTANDSLLRFTGKVGQAVEARWEEQDRLSALVLLPETSLVCEREGGGAIRPSRVLWPVAERKSFQRDPRRVVRQGWHRVRETEIGTSTRLRVR